MATPYERPSRPVTSTSSNASARTPRLVPGVDQRTLPIGPEEAFVLSRVDGRTTQADIGSTTNLDDRTIETILQKLAKLGAICFEDGSRSSPEPTPREEIIDRGSAKLKRPIIEATEVPRFDQRESAALYDPAELDEPCDLDLMRKRTILDVYYRLDQLDHYALLGLPQDAEKKDVKAAYFTHVGHFHPDKYFGKDLGTFRPKLEKVFARLTEAHDTLTRKRTRQEYDDYLVARRRNRALERALYGENEHREELTRAHRRIQESARSTAAGPGHRETEPTDPARRAGVDEFSELRSDRPARPDPRAEPSEDESGPVRAPDPSSPFAERTVARPPARELGTPQCDPRAPPEDDCHAGTSKPFERSNEPGQDESPSPNHRGRGPAGVRPSKPPPDPEARRKAFARRLRRNPQSTPPPGGSGATQLDPSDAKRQVADDLMRMYSHRVRGARDSQVRRYLDTASTALREDNPVAAANALRVASSLDPDNEEIKTGLADAEQQANSKLAGNYLEQAQYEEKEQHWDQAATSYQRAAIGRPTARIHERVAYCLLKADGDMKVACEYGKKAVKLAPNQASMRVTLAEVYLKAGMRQSAVAEFERAQALAPHDDTIKDWLKRIRRNQA